ncbi:hypothetical protein GCK32_013505 [Trichostrongylus colubriformis]|uniref:EB domain-containing protein n=1 Tax=Trichostrongylus colubriformis TaxID=6319 RepID=A0AAN8ICV8_TRICO
MIALHQEPPPVGCPIGTRPLKNASGVELICSTSVPDSCPGGALCYTDSLTDVKRCCGSDPGQGCPSGSRVLLTYLEKPRLCTPGKLDALCPRGALCQWSHLIDRYQCCEPDNGCPRHQAPMKTVNGKPLECSPLGVPCPDGGGCHFNFWTASYQCCKLDTAGGMSFFSDFFCSFLNSISLEKYSAEVRRIHNIQMRLELSRFLLLFLLKSAHSKWLPWGRCRLTACTARNGNTCPSGSQCMDTNIPSQKLCCEEIEYSCPGFSTPYPSSRFPQKCDIMESWRCGERQCMPSNIPNVHICCQSTIIRQRDINPCPSGWAPSDNVITYCTPSYQSSTCPGFSSCLRSNDVQQQFICCVPSQSNPVQRYINA